MNLPIPNAEEVAEFKRLYKEKRGIDLPDDEAYDLALRFLHFYYFATTPPPEPSEERKREKQRYKEREERAEARMRKKAQKGRAASSKNTSPPLSVIVSTMKIQGLADTVAWYDQNAETYAKAQGAWPDLDQIELFVERVSPGALILDAGCAAGRDAALFTEKGLMVEGIDLSEGLIAIAKRNHPEISFQVGNFLHLPFPAAHFDGVWAHQSLLHLETPEDVSAALKEFHRVLKPDGALLVLVKAQMGPDKTAVVNDKLSNHERFFQYFTVNELATLLMGAGFDVDGLERYREIDRNPNGRPEVELILALGHKG